MPFPAFSKSYLWLTHIANYLLPTLSQQTNAHWREYNTCNVNYKIENRLSLYLETSKCFTFQSHHSKFIVSSISGLFLVFRCLILLCIILRTLKNEERSAKVIVSNLSGDKILFSTFYTDLFLLFGKKTWGGGARVPRPLPFLRHCGNSLEVPVIL